MLPGRILWWNLSASIAIRFVCTVLWLAAICIYGICFNAHENRFEKRTKKKIETEKIVETIKLPSSSACRAAKACFTISLMHVLHIFDVPLAVPCFPFVCVLFNLIFAMIYNLVSCYKLKWFIKCNIIYKYSLYTILLCVYWKIIPKCHVSLCAHAKRRLLFLLFFVLFYIPLFFCFFSLLPWKFILCA